MRGTWLLVAIAIIFVIIRIVFRLRSKNYKTIEGRIVDFRTERLSTVDDRTIRYRHDAIIEFAVDGKDYRCVKSSLYHSSSSSWKNSIVASSLGNIQKVRYNPEDPKNNYALYSLKDLKYNMIMLIPVIIAIIVLFIIFYFYGK